MIHRPWFLYGILRSAPWASAGLCTGRGGGYLESAYYREIEAPLDSCWLLGAMIGDGGRTIAFVHLTRPRSARPFTVDDVQRLDRLRPWLAHAFRPPLSGDARREDQAPIVTAGPTVLSGQLIVSSDARLVYQTAASNFCSEFSRESRAITRATCQSATGCPRRF